MCIPAVLLMPNALASTTAEVHHLAFNKGTTIVDAKRKGWQKAMDNR
jgi:hypothetical protein